MYQMVSRNNNNGMIASQTHVPYTNTCSNMSMHNNVNNSKYQYPQYQHQHQQHQQMPMQLDSNPTPKAQAFDNQFPFDDFEYGNESPESMLMSEQSPSPLPVSEESKEESEIEMKSHEQQQQQKDPQDLTYDEITALLGPNTDVSDFLTQLYDEETKQDNAYCQQNAQNPTFHRRRLSVLHSLMQAIKKCDIDPMTGDKAIYYFDKLCAKTEVNKDCVHFAAFICLWIACKYNQTANTMPHINTLIHAYPKHTSFINYTMKDITHAEKKIISSLGFRLKCVLPIEFIEYYLHSASDCCLFPTDKGYDGITHKLVILPVAMQRDIMVYSRFFLNMAHENYELCTNNKASTIAIAVICCARRAVKIVPYFNKAYMLDMFKIDGITQEIDACFNKLWTDYQNKFPNQAEGVDSLQSKSLIEM